MIAVITTEVSTLGSLISTLGFPIACCAYMAWYLTDNASKHREEIKELNKQHTEEIKELNRIHKEEVANMTEAVNNNTVVLERLCVILTGGGTIEN